MHKTYKYQIWDDKGDYHTRTFGLLISIVHMKAYRNKLQSYLFSANPIIAKRIRHVTYMRIKAYILTCLSHTNTSKVNRTIEMSFNRNYASTSEVSKTEWKLLSNIKS